MTETTRFHSTEGDYPGYWGPITSTIDWCEPNYVYSYYVAEWWNTLSSLLMCVGGCVGMYWTVKLGHERRATLFAALICLVGLGSAAFHGSLLFQTQLLDELPMIYAMLMWWYIWFGCLEDIQYMKPYGASPSLSQSPSLPTSPNPNPITDSTREKFNLLQPRYHWMSSIYWLKWIIPIHTFLVDAYLLTTARLYPLSPPSHKSSTVTTNGSSKPSTTISPPNKVSSPLLTSRQRLASPRRQRSNGPSLATNNNNTINSGTTVDSNTSLPRTRSSIRSRPVVNYAKLGDQERSPFSQANNTEANLHNSSPTRNIAVIDPLSSQTDTASLVWLATLRHPNLANFINRSPSIIIHLFHLCLSCVSTRARLMITYALLWSITHAIVGFTVVFQTHFFLLVAIGLLMTRELAKHFQHEPKILTLISRWVKLYVGFSCIAFTFWLTDVHMCSTLRALPVYPQHHAVWHFFVGLSTYSGLVLTVIARRVTLTSKLRIKKAQHSITAIATPENEANEAKTAESMDSTETSVHQLVSPVPRTGDVVISLCGVQLSTKYQYVEGPLGVL